jgi:Flp pilus assembly protein TadG
MATKQIARKLSGTLHRFRTDQRGNITVMMAFLFPVFLGMLGLGFEASNWYRARHAMKNAADAATIAAATNAGSHYDLEAKAVAAQYGYVDGINSVSVTPSNNATCPDGTNKCYAVQITSSIPLFLSQIVGYQGDTLVNTARGKQLTATSKAKPGTPSTQYCILALGGSGQPGITSNGSSKANLSGCDVMSNTSATCNGSNLGASVGDAHGTNKGCGVTQHSNVSTVPDPYSYLASNIPADPCGGNYPQETNKGKGLPSSNQWSGSVSWSGYVKLCGDQQLTGDLTVNAPSGAVLVIYNGQLDANGHKIQTASGSGLSVVFSGTSGSYLHAPTDTSGSANSVLDIAAPTSGTWSGVAIFQDPKLTTGVDISSAGNSPTWDVTGLVYLPHASVNFSGAVNKSSNGLSCFALVVDNVTVNGTAYIYPNTMTQCSAAGLTKVATGGVPSHSQLFY